MSTMSTTMSTMSTTTARELALYIRRVLHEVHEHVAMNLKVMNGVKRILSQVHSSSRKNHRKGGNILTTLYKQCETCCALVEQNATLDGAMPNGAALRDRRRTFERKQKGMNTLQTALRDMLLTETELRLAHIHATQTNRRQRAKGLSPSDRNELRAVMGEFRTIIADERER